MKYLFETPSLRTAVLVLAAGLTGAWVAPMVARAASATSSATLAFAGTLSQNGAPISTPQTVTFTFKKNGGSVCAVPDLPVTPEANGQFTVGIPLANCPNSLFTTNNVKIDISVSGNLVVTDQPVTSVPSALYAEQVGYPDCPPGYDRDASITTIVLCRQGADEVVRIGTKASAFWIDRYEASVWEFADGTGTSYGVNGVSDYPFPVNGQLGATDKGYSISKPGVLPSTFISWFQADVACRASGKRLPTSAEWGIAARGTPDPGNSLGEGGKCRTGGGGVRMTAQGAQCVSVWGAQDMIGNVPEVVSDWLAAPSMSINDANNGVSTAPPWGAAYADDVTTNLVSIAGGETWTYGLPASILRGGGAWEGAGAGVFNLNLSEGPQIGNPATGFRCLIPR